MGDIPKQATDITVAYDHEAIRAAYALLPPEQRIDYRAIAARAAKIQAEEERQRKIQRTIRMLEDVFGPRETRDPRPRDATWYRHVARMQHDSLPPELRAAGERAKAARRKAIPPPLKPRVTKPDPRVRVRGWRETQERWNNGEKV